MQTAGVSCKTTGVSPGTAGASAEQQWFHVSYKTAGFTLDSWVSHRRARVSHGTVGIACRIPVVGGSCRTSTVSCMIARVSYK
jgi:hypothetical protein